MKACIYARTSRAERRHHTTKLEHQITFCQDLARRFNLTVDAEHIFTDIELTGGLLPSCWADDAAPSRPALAALVAAIEQEGVTRVIVHRLETLGNTSLVLEALRDFFLQENIHVVAAREMVENAEEPTGRFALSILHPCLQLNTDAEEETRNRLRARKLDELQRLRAKVVRLEAEIAAL